MAKTPIKTLNGHSLVDETARTMAQEALNKADEGGGGDKVVFFDVNNTSFTYEDGTAISSFDDLHNIFFEMAFGKGKCICQISMDGGACIVGIESLFYHTHNRFWRIVFSPIGSNKLSVMVSIQNQIIEIEGEV